MLASLTFLAPAWAAGFFAAALPIALHLFNKRSGRTATFPAMRFIQQAAADTRRLLRPRQWLLLAMRTTALCLIVLAFMQPVWQSASLQATPSAVGKHVVIVLDRTASMQRAEHGVRLFDQAREQAIETLQRLHPPSDRASVVLLDHTPSPLLPEPTANIAALVQRLRQLEPTYEHGNANAALQCVRALHQHGDDPSHRSLDVDIFTDAQRTQWSGETLRAFLSSNENRSVRIHRLGTSRDNTAVHDPIVEPARPIVGQPVRVSAQVNHWSSQPATVAVQLQTAEQSEIQRIELSRDSMQTVDFETTFDRAGAQSLRINLLNQHDAMPVDDHVGYVVKVRESRHACLVTRPMRTIRIPPLILCNAH